MFIADGGVHCRRSRLIFYSDIEAESDSDIEEDPDFPLPTLSSDDEEDGPASPSRGPLI